MENLKPFILKIKPTILFSEVVAEMKWRYPGLNLKTQAKEFIDLMLIVFEHAHVEEAKFRSSRKIKLAVLIEEAFEAERMN